MCLRGNHVFTLFGIAYLSCDHDVACSHGDSLTRVHTRRPQIRNGFLHITTLTSPQPTNSSIMIAKTQGHIGHLGYNLHAKMVNSLLSNGYTHHGSLGVLEPVWGQILTVLG